MTKILCNTTKTILKGKHINSNSVLLQTTIRVSNKQSNLTHNGGKITKLVEGSK